MTALAFVPEAPHILVATALSGEIRVLRLNRTMQHQYAVQSVECVTNAGTGRFITGISVDPFDPTAFLVTTSVHDFEAKGLPKSAWDNGRIDLFRLFPRTLKLIFERVLVSGLPLARKSQNTGPYGVAIDTGSGALYIGQGSNTNGGVTDYTAGNVDTIVSGTILKVDIRTAGKTRKLEWTTNFMMNASLKESASVSGISVYAIGIRAAFQPLFTRKGHLLSVDTAPTSGPGQRSVTCLESGPMGSTVPDRLLKINRGFWYGMANRARGRKDGKQCTFMWGHESANSTTIRKFRKPIMTTFVGNENGLKRSGTVGLAQYDANWVPSMRGSFLGSGLDGQDEYGGLVMPMLFFFDVRRKAIIKVADAPGVSIEVDAYGAILTAQVSNGKIGVTTPVVKAGMAKKMVIRSVWPVSGKGGSRVHIVGTGLSWTAHVFIGSSRCTTVYHVVRFNYLQDLSCTVPERNASETGPLHVQVGGVTLKKAFTILSSDTTIAI